jgi:hypothetical protein
MNTNLSVLVALCAALALVGCAQADETHTPATIDAGADSCGDDIFIGWRHDAAESCLARSNPECPLPMDTLVLDELTPTLGPDGACWIVPRSQLPREGWEPFSPPDQLPEMCADLMNIPFCGPDCPKGRFAGTRYDRDRNCAEEMELGCRPTNAGGDDAMTEAIGPDGMCWQFPDTQLPGEDWVMAEPSACPESLFSAPACGIDAGTGVGIDSGLSDSGTYFPDAASVGDDAAISVVDAAHD